NGSVDIGRLVGLNNFSMVIKKRGGGEGGGTEGPCVDPGQAEALVCIQKDLGAGQFNHVFVEPFVGGDPGVGIGEVVVPDILQGGLHVGTELAELLLADLADRALRNAQLDGQLGSVGLEDDGLRDRGYNKLARFAAHDSLNGQGGQGAVDQVPVEAEFFRQLALIDYLADEASGGNDTFAHTT